MTEEVPEGSEEPVKITPPSQGIAVNHSNSSRDEKEEKKKHYSE